MAERHTFTITLDDGTTCKSTDLLRLKNAAEYCGYSRMTLLQWAAGNGRGKKEPLKIWNCFGSPTSIPVIPKPYLIAWLERTEDGASDVWRRNAQRKLAETNGTAKSDEDLARESAETSPDDPLVPKSKVVAMLKELGIKATDL